MKIVAYTALLYGSDYLAYAIRSVIDHVDEYHVIYDASGHGSHGHKTDRECPDSQGLLMSIATQAAGAKLRWHEGYFQHEGYQREAIHQYAPDADVIIPLDYDEIWEPGLVELAINAAINGNVERWRVPFRHYWRSFYRCILHDPAYPHRVIAPGKCGESTLDAQGKAVNHCGYAILPEIMEWKWLVHGHKGELRHDVDYFKDIYRANRQYDCHPCGSEYWTPESVDPADYFPAWMNSHPYWGRLVIE